MRLTARDRLAYLAAILRHRWQTLVPEVYRVYVRRTPLGAELDMSALVEALVKQLAENYADDPEGVCDSLERIATLANVARDGYGRDSAGWAGAERDDLIERLIKDMGGARQIVRGEQGRLLGELIVEYCSYPSADVVALPKQRKGGAAA